MLQKPKADAKKEYCCSYQTQIDALGGLSEGKLLKLDVSEQLVQYCSINTFN